MNLSKRKKAIVNGGIFLEIALDLKKTANQNAMHYFEELKKARKKLEGVGKAIPETMSKMEKLKVAKVDANQIVAAKKAKKEWYEKFHWFFSSDGLLVIGGKDATSNEVVVKKYMEPKDLHFHAEIVGAPHVVVKCEKKNEAPQKTVEEAAQFAAIFSRAWQSGVAAADVYSVLPEQVSKKAPSGEFMAKGAFMIYGERKWFRKVPLECAVGIEKGVDNLRVISGPKSAIEKTAEFFVEIGLGDEKKGEMAKRLKKMFEDRLGQKDAISLDDVVAMLPNGGLKLKEKR